MGRNLIPPIEERILKLPKWAQEYIQHLKAEVEIRNSLVKAHAVLCDEDRDWFTIRNLEMDDSVMHLWILNKDKPFPVCDLTRKDILIVGRGNKRSERSDR